MEATVIALRQAAVLGVVAFVAYGLNRELRGELSEGMLWTLVWVFIAADIVLSLVPGGDASDPLNARDKLVHVLVYAVLVVILLFALVWRPTRGYGRWPEGAAAVLFGALALGAALEVLQRVVGRDASALDGVANAIGGLFGLFVWRLVALRATSVAAAPQLALYEGGSMPPPPGNGRDVHGSGIGAASEPRRAELEALAFLLMPAQRLIKGVMVEADGSWRSPGWHHVEAEQVVWGRSWLGANNSLTSAVRFAVHRERALRRMKRRPPDELEAVAVHRLRPPARGPTARRGNLRGALLGGALVELTGGGGVHRVIDAAAAAAGAREPVARFTRGSGATAVASIHRADGERGMLRVAREGSPGDPARAGDALRYAGPSSVDEVPRLLTSGRCAGASWTLESFMEGRVPRRADDGLMVAVGRVLSRLPRTHSRPQAPVDDLRVLAGFLPNHADLFLSTARAVQDALASLPGMMRHGDLWVSNLLVSRSRLVGILDWDSWHAFGAPGTDLLYLFVTERWRRTRLALGDLWSERPWRTRAFMDVTVAYWERVGSHPDARALDAIGVSAWAAQLASSLVRLPQLVSNQRWMTNNPDKLVSFLAHVS